MLTGDSRRTAEAVASRIGIDEFCAEVLPEDKANYVAALRAQGHTVIMVGDGINDSPALSEADAGIAVSDGAAIAQEIADITIAAESLWELSAAAAACHGVKQPHPQYLPLCPRVQWRADRPGGCRAAAALRIGDLAQPFHAGDQPAQHDLSSLQRNRNNTGKMIMICKDGEPRIFCGSPSLLYVPAGKRTCLFTSSS